MTNPSFKEAFSVLEQHAKTLSEQQEPDIDALLTIVTESVAAYKVCLERIDAVERVLEKAQESTMTEPKEIPRTLKPSRPETFDDFTPQGKNVPFFRLLVQPQLRATINRFN